MCRRPLRLVRWTYVIELEGKPENGWVIHRQLLALLEEMKKKAEGEALTVKTAFNNSDKGQGGLLKRGIVGGAKSLYNYWWSEPEVEEPGSP